jgi:hypothetical protein
VTFPRQERSGNYFINHIILTQPHRKIYSTCFRMINRMLCLLCILFSNSEGFIQLTVAANSNYMSGRVGKLCRLSRYAFVASLVFVFLCILLYLHLVLLIQESCCRRRGLRLLVFAASPDPCPGVGHPPHWAAKAEHFVTLCGHS